MAEAYARALGSDVIEAMSAGVSPLGHIPSEVAEVMAEEGISIEGQHSKSLWDLKGGVIDLIVDLAGVLSQSASGVPIDSRPVVDPFGGELEDYRTTRDAVRVEVEAIIEDLRVQKSGG
jgi:protein-tyrosine-phosphatase